MGVLTYNGVTLPYPLTTRFDQAAVMDDSKTDFMATKYDILQQCVINLDYLDTIAPELVNPENNNNAAAVMNAIRKKLLTPRRALSYNVNGVEMIPSITGGVSLNTTSATIVGTVDALNGPQPQSCNVTLLTNVTFLVTYHIIAHYWENVQSVDPHLNILYATGNNVLSNRWEESISYDNCMVATKHRAGKIVIRSDNVDGKIVDEVRESMAVVAVPAGFIRVSAEYKVDTSGLIMTYSITDKQVYKMPPPPAYEASGKYTETLVKNGAVKYGDFHIRLKGCNNAQFCTQDQLITVALAMATQKLAIRGFAEIPQPPPPSAAEIIVTDFYNWWNGTQVDINSLNNNGKIPERFSILHRAVLSVDLFENVIDLAITCRFSKDKSRSQGIAGFQNAGGTMTWTPYSSIKAAPFYTSRGTDSILLQAARYYDPSLRNTKLVSGLMTAGVNQFIDNGPPQVNFNNGLEVGTAGIDKET